MDKSKQEMEMMHTMCHKEIQQLQKRLTIFLEESNRVQIILSGRKTTKDSGITDAGGAHINGGDSSGNRSNMFALIAFDRYMSQVGTVVNMARKFNIHLQINKLTNTVIDPSANGSMEGCNASQSRILQDYIEWSNSRLVPDIRNNLLTDGGSTSEALGFDVIESLTWKNDNLNITSPAREDCILKRNFKGNSLNQIVVNMDKNIKSRCPEQQSVDKMTMLENFLKIILPTKSLAHFKEGHEFSGSITYVHDYKNLVFYICEQNDFEVLREMSNSVNLPTIERSSRSDAVFCVSQDKSENEQNKECVWRAVMVPEEGNDTQDSVFLIDFGEIVALTDQCELYKVPVKYRQTPPLAIKCILKGVQDSCKFITRDSEKCEQALRFSEYKLAQFRVVQQENRVLHLVLLEKSSNESSKEPSVKNESFCEISNNRNNPFIDPTRLFEDEDEENSSDPLPLPISAVYSAFAASSSNVTPTSTPTLNVSAQLGDQLQILVTHVISPIAFYAIIENTCSDESKTFSWPNHEITAMQKQMSPPQLNDIVLSQYIKDEYWYRAKVIDILAEQNLYKVFYVDFGNTEIVPLNCLAKCSKQQYEDPLRAVLFRLENLSTVIEDADDKYDTTLSAIESRLQKAIETVVMLILDQTLNVEVTDRHKDDLVVRITDPQYADLPKMLVNMGVAKEV